MKNLVLALPLVVAGCFDPVIGAECRPEYPQCGHVCCDIGQMCVDEMCVGGGNVDAGTGDTGTGEECPLGRVFCDGECVRPDLDRRHCGDCGRACPEGRVCVDGECAESCPAPRLDCDGACVDPATDPEHCGGCGVRCGSGVCETTCLPGVAGLGHVVVIGHDYRASSPAQDLVLGNAVLMPVADPLRLVEFVGSANAASAMGADRAIDAIAAADGQTVMRSVAAEADVPAAIANADTFLIHAQRDRTDAQLRDLGRRWRAALVGLVRRGGTIVLLDAGGEHGGVHQILEPSGLFGARARHAVADGAPLVLVDATDAVAPEVPLSYPAAGQSASFERPTGNVVLRENGNPRYPVVVHRAVATARAE